MVKTKITRDFTLDRPADPNEINCRQMWCSTIFLKESSLGEKQAAENVQQAAGDKSASKDFGDRLWNLREMIKDMAKGRLEAAFLKRLNKKLPSEEQCNSFSECVAKISSNGRPHDKNHRRTLQIGRYILLDVFKELVREIEAEIMDKLQLECVDELVDPDSKGSLEMKSRRETGCVGAIICALKNLHFANRHR